MYRILCVTIVVMEGCDGRDNFELTGFEFRLDLRRRHRKKCRDVNSNIENEMFSNPAKHDELSSPDCRSFVEWTPSHMLCDPRSVLSVQSSTC